MPFSLIHKIASYLLVATGLLALFSSGEFSSWLIGGCVIALLGSWWWDAPRVDFERLQTPWNVATVLILGLSVLDVISGTSVLIAAIHFVLYLGINKVYNRKASADYLHLYVLSFLQMVAATVLSTDLLFGVLFLFYIVFLTWALFLFHLKREMEENFLLKYRDSLEGRPVKIERVLNSRRLVGMRFLGATSMVAIVVFLGAVVFFVSFPRIGLRMFNQQRAGIAMTGFSDQLELGHFGRIKDDPTVVLRVEFDDPNDRNRLAPYWRGISFDHYDGRAWSKSESRDRRPLRSRGHRYLIHADGDEPGVKQSIYLEPMETRVLFGLSRMGQVALPRPAVDTGAHDRQLYLSVDGDLHYEQRDEIAFRYEVTSHPERGAAQLDMPLGEYQRQVRYAAQRSRHQVTQVPADLSAEITALAARVIGNAVSVGDAVDRVEAHLRDNYAYTLDLGRDDARPPLDDFLFVQRKGHCEYFSSAMVILLRSQGIAARSVNGFYGGEWNHYGNYLAIRQGDAHSWVEIGLPVEICPPKANGCYSDFRWLTRDPTPPSTGAQTAQLGLWDTLRQYADALRMRWYRNVIEYDIEQQIGFATSLRAAWKSVFGTESKASAMPSRRTVQRTLIWILSAVLLLAVILLLVRRLRALGDTPRQGGPHQGTLLFERLVGRYTILGYPRPPHLTAREYVEHLAEVDAPEMEVARRVLQHYEAARFQDAPPDDATARRLRKEIAMVRPPSP